MPTARKHDAPKSLAGLDKSYQYSMDCSLAATGVFIGPGTMKSSKGSDPFSFGTMKKKWLRKDLNLGSFHQIELVA